jgi:formylglycine-generating enzyme required for sulfatase activity
MHRRVCCIVRLAFLFSALIGVAPVSAAPGDSIIIIANKTYRSGVAPVEYADRDADAMQRAAVEAMGIEPPALRRFNDMTIGEANEWFRPDGTPGASLVEFIRKASGNRRNATIYFYYSGHGVATRNERRQQDEMHFVLFDTRTDAVGSQGLSIEAVKRALAQVQKDIVPAGQVVMMVDACFSGFGRDGKEVWKGARAGAVPAKLAAPDKVVILSAAGPAEPAWSDLQRKLGAFTDALVDGFYGSAADSAGRITAEQLLAFVEHRVSSRLSRQPAGARSQSPMLTGDRASVVATVRTPFPERTPGTRERFARRCAVVGVTNDISVVRNFLQSECDEDCPCRASLETKIREREKVDGQCKEERDDLLALKARGAAALPEMKALAGAVHCEAVKLEIASAVAEFDTAQREAARRAQEAQAKARAAREAKERADKEERDRLDVAAREMAAKEAEIRAKKEAKERADKEAERSESAARDLAAKEADIRAKKEAKDRAEREPPATEDETTRRGESEARDDGNDRSDRVADADPAKSITPGSGASFRDCDDCPEMVVVPAESFVMGSPDSEAGRATTEGPERRVRLDDILAIGKFEVTREQFDAFVKAERHKTSESCRVLDTDNAKWATKKGATWRRPGFEQSDRHPAVCIDWNDAKAYVEWLSRHAGRNYRLLTEAEWEYAARAGTTGAFSTGRTITTDEANYNGNHAYEDGRKGILRGGTVRVGTFGANDWGLHDMHGNVWEWVEDCFEKSYSNAPVDGSAVTEAGCTNHTVRGGSWASHPNDVRSATRYHAPDGLATSELGFRVARTID